MTLLLGFAAVNTGNNLLFLIVSAMLGFMATSGVLGWLNIRGIEVRLTLPREIYRATPCTATLELTNRRLVLPSFLLRVSVMSGAGTLLALPRHGTARVAIQLVFPARGRGTIDRLHLASPFPVGFFVRSRPVTLKTPYLVFPAPVKSPIPGSGDEQGHRGEHRPFSRGLNGDLERIGEYSGREPLKLIHWRLSARHGSLKVKEFAATGADPLTLDLEQLSGENREEMLGRAAYLVNHLIRANRPLGLKLPHTVIPPAADQAHRLRLLRELALYGTD